MIDCRECIHFKVCQSCGVLTGRLTSCADFFADKGQAGVKAELEKSKADVKAIARFFENLFQHWDDTFNICDVCGREYCPNSSKWAFGESRQHTHQCSSFELDVEAIKKLNQG